MIKSGNGAFELKGSFDECGADLGIAIIGFRDAMIENGLPAEIAYEVLGKIMITALKCGIDEGDES